MVVAPCSKTVGIRITMERIRTFDSFLILFARSEVVKPGVDVDNGKRKQK